MAQIHLYNREHDKALEAAEKAVLARPSCDLSYVAKANILTYLDRPTEAIDLAKFAIRLAPVYPPFFQKTLAAAFYGSGRYEEAIESAREVLKTDKDNLDAFLTLAGANAALDRQNEASKAASAVRRIKPDFTLTKYAETQRYKDPKKLEQITSMLRMAGLH
jgi:tetratricopeptide (TPR) repeat protein